MDLEESLVVFPKESEVESYVCVCGFPILDEDCVSCVSCEQLYHRRCVARQPPGELPVSGGAMVDGGTRTLGLGCDNTWICDTCVQLLSGDDFNQGRV